MPANLHCPTCRKNATESNTETIWSGAVICRTCGDELEAGRIASKSQSKRQSKSQKSASQSASESKRDYAAAERERRERYYDSAARRADNAEEIKAAQDERASKREFFSSRYYAPALDAEDASERAALSLESQSESA